jgi:transposase
MLIVETVVRIRREYAHGKPIKEICRGLKLSRKTVRKALRSDEAEFKYERTTQSFPKLGAYRDRLDKFLLEDAGRPRREKLRLTRIWDLLVQEGYDGSYDSVRRYATRWRREAQSTAAAASAAFVPQTFAPGEAFQFDWSHEDVEIAGKPMRVKVAHLRLCASRAFYIRAYPRETQEMVFDAHTRAFAFLGGVPQRGIYDNMKTAVDAVFVGKARTFNRRLLLMADHYLFTPTACTPASGWEKGQVESQVNFARGRFFQPRLRFVSLEELNAWLETECLRWFAQHPHPEQREITVAQALEAERPALQRIFAPFDGFHETEHAVTGTCLISFDRNRYSVMAKAARRTVQVRAYADRIVVRFAGETIAEHARQFGRDRTIYDPWHYLPVLIHKPGALRNGAPFKDWALPPALSRLKRKLGDDDDGHRRFVRILAAIPDHGLDAVEIAVREALDAGVASDDVILNILARAKEPPRPEPLSALHAVALQHPPIADCARYDLLRGHDAAA